MNNNNINPTNIFLKSACKFRIKQLLSFYNNPSNNITNDNPIEQNLLRLAINECTKPKCPVGKYNLYGKCLNG